MSNWKRIEEKLDRLLEVYGALLAGQEELKARLDELENHPMEDKLQVGLEAILGYAGPKAAGAGERGERA